MKFKIYSNGAWTDAPYYIMRNGSWTSITDVHEMDNGAWFPISSWDGFRNLVRSGTASSLYPIGTELYETWGDNTSNAWIIVDYDNNDYMDPDLTTQGYTHNVILMEKNLEAFRVNYQEAVLYLTNPLPAGKYTFMIPSGYDDSHGGSKTYAFTSTTGIPAGGQLVLQWLKGHNPANIQGFATPYASTQSFVATLSVYSGGTYTDLGIVKFANSGRDTTYGTWNWISRAAHFDSSNNYYQSSLRQWINSDLADEWWNPGCNYSRFGNEYVGAGKLYTLNSDMKSVLATPTIPCRTNNVFETGEINGSPATLNTAYTVRDKMFIPSHTELGLTSTPAMGSRWSYFSTSAQTRRVRTYNGTATAYITRNPVSSTAEKLGGITTTGAESAGIAYLGYGSTPFVCACTIQ